MLAPMSFGHDIACFLFCFAFTTLVVQNTPDSYFPYPFPGIKTGFSFWKIVLET